MLSLRYKTVSDANSVNGGVYELMNRGSNFPSNISEYGGTLISFKDNKNAYNGEKFQLYFDSVNNNLYFRGAYHSQPVSWTAWKKISAS